MIGFKTAFLLYALLLAAALFTLHGPALTLALVIVAGFAAKTAVDFFRRRMDH
jgi:hypothetical protein